VNRRNSPARYLTFAIGRFMDKQFPSKRPKRQLMQPQFWLAIFFFWLSWGFGDNWKPRGAGA
jgi:hypothetical protein